MPEPELTRAGREWIRDHIIDPIADRIATEYGAARVTPPTKPGPYHGMWIVEGDRLGTITPRLTFTPAGVYIGGWDPDDTVTLLREEGLIADPDRDEQKAAWLDALDGLGATVTELAALADVDLHGVVDIDCLAHDRLSSFRRTSV